MLGVSLKLCENVDLVGPLQNYIKSNYTDAEAKSVAKPITDLNLARQRLVQFLQRNESDHVQALDFFTSYYRSLKTLESRFPFGKENQSSILGIKTGKVPTVKIPFTWYGSFRHSKKVVEYDLNMEKAAILFNIGALYSRQATKVKSGASAKDDSGLKEACGYFQQASGVFEWMASSSDVAAASQWDQDFNIEALQMLARLMLAQAQACFFEKATTSASPKLVAKLAAGVSELFRQTHQLCESPRLKQFFTSDMYPWDAHLQYQIHCYQAAAFYWQAKQLLAEDQYGAEIGHLEKAKRVVESAKRFESQLLKTLADNRSKLEANIVSRYTAANKDNETIYFVQVPKPDTVRDIEGIVNVKPVAWAVQPGEDHYQALVPPQAREAAAQFQIQLRDALSSASKSATEASNYAKMHLSSLNLPAALEAMEPAKGIPPDVWASVEEVKYKGGPSALAELNDRVASATMDAEQQHQHIVDTLNKEKTEDHAMRQQFQHKWNRKPSEQITVQFHKDSDAIASYLREASASNTKVRSDWSSNLDALEILTRPREQVEAQLPQVQTTGEQKTEASEALRGLLDQLSSLLAARDRALASATSTVESYSIVPLLVSQRNRPQESIFAEELGKLDIRSELDPLEKQQEELLAQITKASEVFEATRAKNDTSIARQKVIQSLNVGVQVFNRLLANFSEGLKFYSDLIGTKIVPLKQRVDDYIIARDLEKRMILEQLTKDAAGYTEQLAAPTSASASASTLPSASTISGSIPYPVVPSGSPQVAINPNNVLDEKNAHPHYAFTSPPPSNPELAGLAHDIMAKVHVTSPQPTPTPTTALQPSPSPSAQPAYSPAPQQLQQAQYQAPQHPQYQPYHAPQMPTQQPTYQPQQHQQQGGSSGGPAPPPSYQQWHAAPAYQPQQHEARSPSPSSSPSSAPQYQPVPSYRALAAAAAAAAASVPPVGYHTPYQQPPYGAPSPSPSTSYAPAGFAYQQSPPVANGAWNCKACTFENAASNLKCSMCDTAR